MFGGGGGGLDPRKMEQMMKQMGIDVDSVDATEVIIRVDEDTELVFDSPQVTKMDARGQNTYQVVGSPEERDRTDTDTQTETVDIPDEDVEMVAMRADVDEETAREALKQNDGDLAAAVAELE
ncbi:nascent polypeptide-associated complex protein [Salinarchaeum sp. IM2453]|uniref:nascent polypeptide-associated complex protein n=1 Tax=Salinarchaeum sp. IM2453 TaxID=2862870 RepID=UPI001C829BA4|nr:nascent polypeptide-associated complex protein [Salinarchaeum sp. IM2453]QZA87521.1 nascent polypeptide-associated complex protein [Salinarchaeum sp. IM2453]